MARLACLACLASSYLASPEQPSGRPFAASCEASVASCWAFVLLLLRLASVEGCPAPRMPVSVSVFVLVLVLEVAFAGRPCLGIGLGLGFA